LTPVPESSRASTAASVGRRSSYGLRRASSSRRPSVSHRTDHAGRQVLQRLENTYRMEPDDKDRFHPGVVEEMLGN